MPGQGSRDPAAVSLPYPGDATGHLLSDPTDAASTRSTSLPVPLTVPAWARGAGGVLLQGRNEVPRRKAVPAMVGTMLSSLSFSAEILPPACPRNFLKQRVKTGVLIV